jgi:two-component system chemotaxis response regulator CheY
MNKKILIVDDSSMMRLVVSKAAKKEGYEVIEANDGKEGLKQLLKHDDIALILSDINMPVMDGLEMVSKIKENDTLKYIPIVMLTTERSDELKQKGKDLGVKAWMVKPFNEATFIKAMMKIIG